MSKSPFGWSYPPGAENDPSAPYNQDSDGITTLQCDILEMLEKAGISESYCDKIMELIQLGEQQRQDAEDAAMVDELAEAHRLEREESEYLEDQAEKERE